MTVEQNTRELEHAKAVRAMFSGIAGKYDTLNHLLSMNIDKRWRRKVRLLLEEQLSDPDAVVLDVACGTGDLSIEMKQNASAKIIGVDFCRPMLAVAATKTTEIPFVEGDGMKLGFADESVNALTIAFGLRNLSNFREGLAEFYRVLKHGGKLVILEFSAPVVPGFRGLFNFYFANILPRIGGMVSGERGAYEYLPDSVSKFPDQKNLAKMITDIGFKNVEYSNLTGGIAAIHSGIKPK